MVNYTKSQPPPASLAIEKAKGKSGKYNEADVLERLEADFYNKCYICEQKAPIAINVEHLVSHAARMRNRTRGRLTCPMVLRAPFGGGIHAPEHHSESTEALFAHIPGLRVVIPSSPTRAYGLLLTAI